MFNCPYNDGAGLLSVKETRESGTRAAKKFEDSDEWKWTKATCHCLFRTLGEYYDELWFPTVIKEWSSLYYRCNHPDNYWEYRDEWLAGDDDVRLIMWGEVINQRVRHDRRNDKWQERMMETSECDPIAAYLMKYYGTEDTRNVYKIREIHQRVNEATDTIKLEMPEEWRLSELVEAPTEEEMAKAELEAAELALADPDEYLDWLFMRSRMRASLTSFMTANREVDSELLNHIMIELCKFWANRPCIDESKNVEPLLERNIVREIENFQHQNNIWEPHHCIRTSEPEPQRELEPEPEECCGGGPEEPVECRRDPPPASVPKRSRSTCNSIIRPRTTKLAEARARQSAARARN